MQLAEIILSCCFGFSVRVSFKSTRVNDCRSGLFLYCTSQLCLWVNNRIQKYLNSKHFKQVQLKQLFPSRGGLPFAIPPALPGIINVFFLLLKGAYVRPWLIYGEKKFHLVDVDELVSIKFTKQTVMSVLHHLFLQLFSASK